MNSNTRIESNFINLFDLTIPFSSLHLTHVRRLYEEIYYANSGISSFIVNFWHEKMSVYS